MLKKIMNLVGASKLPKLEQVEVTGGKVTSVSASFKCYCNSIFVGEKSSVKECWKTC